MTSTTTNLPYQASPASLARATMAAAAAAVAILTLFVLPAEWGIDPTGVGKTLGLTSMASGAEANDSETPETPSAADDLVVIPQTKTTIEARAVLRSDEKTLTLPPHSGVEVKAHMVKGDHLIFRWTSNGAVRMDMHGEPKGGKEGEFTSYWKQKDLNQAQGSFTAPFEGTHGWYWRNGGDTPVTITLKTSGFYKDLFEPPVE